jgi:uncharacterized protein YcbK (DUF882 family)
MTVKQKQNLLAYLGYYVGNIDGDFGQLSKTATIAFQKDFGAIAVDGIVGKETEKALKHAVAYGMPAKKETSDESEATTEESSEAVAAGYLTKHFKRSEFRCKCGKYCDGYPVEPSKELLELLENIRNHFDAPVTVSSGVRCKQHNTNVGGASKSQHMYGTAADIKVAGKTPKQVASYAETLMPNSGGIGLYSTWTHVDVRSTKARWNG